MGEVVIEHSWMSADIVSANPNVHQHLVQLGLEPQLVEHEVFKAAVLSAAFAVRTGEDTFFANVLCRAGVPFASPTVGPQADARP
jgi:D-ribose pyranase